MGATHPNAERPRLLVVAPSAYPLGGVATWLDGLISGLRARGWKLEIALLSGRHHDVDRYLERHPLGSVRRIENRGGSREGRLRALERAIAGSTAEVVLSVNTGDIEDAVDRVRRNHGRVVRLLTTQHALQPDYFEHLRSRADIVDGVVATNRLTAQLVAEMGGLEPERIRYAPYGVAIESCPRPATGGPTLRIVWVGRLEEPQKRASTIVAITRELERREVAFRLEIAGSGAAEPQLRRELEPAIDAGRAAFLGELSSAELLAPVYARNDVLLVTSSWETGPIVAWEALVAGLAVVSTRFVGCGLEGALRHGETALLFDVGDAEGAATAIARLREPELRHRLASAGLAEVRRRYSREVSLDTWACAVEELSRLEPRAPRVEPVRPSRSGRLDQLLGPRLGEGARTLLGVRNVQPAPGDEWPHALVRADDFEAFLRRAVALEGQRSGRGGVGDAG